ncbi:Sua5/YciO/YrdC/YwlC family protein [bacterium]|nr:Sua5/YciO/YrdC/YwlC family protein [bacterium]
MSQQNTSITEAVSLLREGNNILLKSHEPYLCCDATQSEAISRLIPLLGESQHLNPLLFTSSFAMLEGYIPEIPEAAYQIIEVSETPVIVEFSVHRNLAQQFSETPTIKTVLIQNGIVQQLINRFRKPLIAFSTEYLGQLTSDKSIETNALEIDLSSRILFHSDQSFKIVRD